MTAGGRQGSVRVRARERSHHGGRPGTNAHLVRANTNPNAAEEHLRRMWAASRPLAAQRRRRRRRYRRRGSRRTGRRRSGGCPRAVAPNRVRPAWLLPRTSGPGKRDCISYMENAINRLNRQHPIREQGGTPIAYTPPPLLLLFASAVRRMCRVRSTSSSAGSAPLGSY